MSSFYSRIIKQFPHKNIKFAFAYGSGVFKQLDNEDPATVTSSNSIEPSKNMIDFVFVVDNSVQFHDKNLKQNWSHYSFLKYLGPYYVSKIQEEYGAACYYNTLVPLKLDDVQSHLIKYGVISEKDLIRDLFDWDHMYISGRLQKPVKIIHFNHENLLKQEDSLQVDKSFELALQTNLQNALNTALLLMPQRFTLEELFICITSLSYMGDFRMVIGENKKKVANIVQPQMERFIELYRPYLVKETIENYLQCNFDTRQVTQSHEQSAVYHHLSLLPKNLIQTIINLKFKTSHYLDMDEYIYKLTSRVDYKEIVAQSVNNIVMKSSFTQSAKSALTAGVFKTVNYSLRKLNKMVK